MQCNRVAQTVGRMINGVILLAKTIGTEKEYEGEEEVFSQGTENCDKCWYTRRSWENFLPIAFNTGHKIICHWIRCRGHASSRHDDWAGQSIHHLLFDRLFPMSPHLFSGSSMTMAPPLVDCKAAAAEKERHTVVTTPPQRCRKPEKKSGRVALWCSPY